MTMNSKSPNVCASMLSIAAAAETPRVVDGHDDGDGRGTANRSTSRGTGQVARRRLDADVRPAYASAPLAGARVTSACHGVAASTPARRAAIRATARCTRRATRDVPARPQLPPSPTRAAAPPAGGGFHWLELPARPASAGRAARTPRGDPLLHFAPAGATACASRSGSAGGTAAAARRGWRHAPTSARRRNRSWSSLTLCRPAVAADAAHRVRRASSPTAGHERPAAAAGQQLGVDLLVRQLRARSRRPATPYGSTSITREPSSTHSGCVLQILHLPLEAVRQRRRRRSPSAPGTGRWRRRCPRWRP